MIVSISVMICALFNVCNLSLNVPIADCCCACGVIDGNCDVGDNGRVDDADFVTFAGDNGRNKSPDDDRRCDFDFAWCGDAVDNDGDDATNDERGFDGDGVNVGMVGIGNGDCCSPVIVGDDACGASDNINSGFGTSPTDGNDVLTVSFLAALVVGDVVNDWTPESADTCVGLTNGVAGDIVNDGDVTSSAWTVSSSTV